ncbi:MAG TPA: flagellar biosynthesis protein FlaG [Desulfocapsa sulfexigens]|nr:flagellar biosynthesis protein FlaG [Desulfocapsa sulfexigens]
MNIEALTNAGNSAQPRSQVSDQVDSQRKNKEKVADTPQASSSEKIVQPEELLSQIKSVTEDGLYSVRFERDDNAELIVKIFDNETEEVIRQIPAEEILQLRQTLEDLRGNIVDTVG